jgi:hypothetical protein
MSIWDGPVRALPVRVIGAWVVLGDRMSALVIKLHPESPVQETPDQVQKPNDVCSH